MTDQAPEQPTQTTPPRPPAPPAAPPAPPARPEPKQEASQPVASNTEPDTTRDADAEALLARDIAVEERVAQYEGDEEAQARVRESLTSDTTDTEEINP